MSFSALEEENEDEIKYIDSVIINKLLNLNTCKKCIRFYLRQFRDPNFVEDYIDGLHEKINKKAKYCPCRCCLDIFHTIKESIPTIVEDLKQRKLNKVILTCHFPKSLLLRMKCFHIMLPEKYPGYYEQIEFPGVSQYLMDEIKNELKKYDINPTRNTHVTLKIVFQYADDTQEVLKMPQLSEKHISAMHVREFRQYLPKIDNYTMKKHFGVPPDTPEKSVYLEEYLLLYAPIYICGRYNRYTKKIFQDHHPNSIEQIVIKAISTVMRTPKENIKVSFCGKDGAFDRILENGKPFFVAITNHNIPLRGLTHTQLDQIEHLCNLVEDCRIFRLSNTVFKSFQLLSEFEKMGCRKYDLIVWTDAPNVAQCIACLNREGEKVPMLITQKTPISALKYRPLLTRTRYVRLLKAEPIEGENCKFKMLLKVDAGTYVDELFHGDLGRTTPSISTIIGGFNVVITHRDLLDLEGEIPSYDDEPLENEAQSSYTED